MSKLVMDLGKTLTDKQIIQIAADYKLTFAHLKAIISVETNGKGFIEVDNVITLLPKVRLEEHHFSKHTRGKYDKSHPHLSSKIPNNTYDKWGLAEYKRFEEAYKLDGEAAVYSTSFGIGQVLGFNWKECGYATLTNFLNDVYSSEAGQLKVMMGFIANHPVDLLTKIRNLEWTKFAYYYNGSNYSINQYDKKLELAYLNFK
jgi:hypothetical protein